MATKVISTPLGQKSSWWDRIYLKEIGRGMIITIGHFFRNMANLRKNQVGLTYQWPEQPKPLPERWRGEHRLMQREDGTPRCVSCNLCATACPAECMEIVAADTGHDGVEKYPVKFDIDILQCIFCGMCVEACPCDAIRMDTGKFSPAYYEGPVKILNIDYLLQNHPADKSKISDAIY